MDKPVHLRCLRCFSLVAPSEASCAGCGTVFSREEIDKAMGNDLLREEIEAKARTREAETLREMRGWQ